MATTYELIASQVLTGTTSSVTFSSIANTYTDLLIKCSMRTNRAATEDPILITFNSGGTYADRRIWSNGSGTPTSYGNSILEAQYADAASSTSNTFQNFEMYIPNYTSSNAKSISYDSVNENNGNPAYAILDAASWTKSPQEAISSITFVSNTGNSFVQYCSFYLYGIKNS